MSDLENPTPGGTAVATPSEPTPSAGTVQPNGDATGQGAPVEEVFGNVDPRTLPPQLRSVYDNMLRGFKEKTTKLSETVKSEAAKQTEAYRKKAEFYDQFAGQADAVKWWNEYVKQQTTQGQEPVDAQGNPIISEVQEKVQELEGKILKTELLEVTAAYADAVNDKGEKLRPDFDKLNMIMLGNDGKGEYSLLRAAIELSSGETPEEKLDNGYKIAKKTYDAIFEEGRKAGLGRIQSKILNSSQPPTGVAPGIQSVTEKKPKNAREALEMARKGIAVSRE